MYPKTTSNTKKKLLNDRARDIFDMLMKHGSLARSEMATILKVNDRGHAFSYGLKDLKTKNLLTADGKKVRLSDEAFLSPENRTETVDVDPEVIEKGRAIIEGNMKKRSDKGDYGSNTKKVKKEDEVVMREKEEESVKEKKKDKKVKKMTAKKVKTKA